MSQRPAIILAAMGLLCSSAAAQDTLTLADVLATVRSKHPALISAQANADAVRARINMEKVWENPRAGIEWKRDGTTRFNAYSEFEVTLSQELPISHRNRLRSETVSAEADEAAAAVKSRERILLKEARSAYVNIAAIDTKLSVNEKLHALLQQSAPLARQAYTNGQRPQTDAISIESNLIRLDAENNDLAAERAEFTSTLNALMQRPAATPIPRLHLPEPGAPLVSPEQALANALHHHPELILAEHRVHTAESKLTLVRKNRIPDPEIMLRARRMNGSGDTITAYDTGISFSIPWLNARRNRAEIASAEFAIKSAQADSRAAESELTGMIAGMHQRAALTFTQINRYTSELLPLARHQADLERQSYETGRVALLDVFMAERVVLETERALADALGRHALAKAELDFLTASDVIP